MGNSTKSSELELGTISGIFGVKGEVRLFLHNPESHLLDGPVDVTLVGPEGQRRAARVSARPGAGKRILGRLEGVSSRDEAASWMGWRIVVDHASLPDLEDDEYYVWQLEGAEVQQAGERVGRVAAVHTGGPVEIFEIHGAGEPWFVPSTGDFVERVDLEAQVVHLRPDAAEE
ncbi:MAG: ribosome maturation factor RimM [Myxococcales bacterium]|nr:ribosome maturation factor RimM [Myxococcales bacterium]